MSSEHNLGLEIERLHDRVNDAGDALRAQMALVRERDAKTERLMEALRLMLEVAPRGVLNAKEEIALKAAYAALAGNKS